MNFKLLASLVATLLIFGGCSSAQKGPVPVPNPRSLSDKGGKEWWKIYSVEFQGDRKVRNHIGFFYRKYDDQHPKGFYWVVDRELNYPELGFLLPETFKSFMIMRGTNGKLESQDLGIADRDLGIKKILQLPLSSAIELEKVPLTQPVSPLAITGSAR